MVKDYESKIEIYLTKEGQNNLEKREIIAILQLLRIIDALRFKMTLTIHTKDEKDDLFLLSAHFEIYTLLASTFKEATKEFYNNLCETLYPLLDDEELKKSLKEYDNKTRNYQNDEVLRIIDYIRNNFSFHLKSELIKKYIVEKDAKEDMLIGIARSKRRMDCCFLPGYDALIYKLCAMAESLDDENKIHEWLFDNIKRESEYFFSLLENLAGCILKKYAKQRYARNSNV